jgi:DNA-binding transcriptional MocR family regulator
MRKIEIWEALSRPLYLGLTAYEAMVLGYLLGRRNNEDMNCYPGLEKISRELVISRSTAQRACSSLAAKGFLRKKLQREKHQPTIYYLDGLEALVETILSSQKKSPDEQPTNTISPAPENTQPAEFADARRRTLIEASPPDYENDSPEVAAAKSTAIHHALLRSQGIPVDRSMTDEEYQAWNQARLEKMLADGEALALKETEAREAEQKRFYGIK